MATGLSIRVISSLSDCPAADWDRCAGVLPGHKPSSPFTTHRFLYALEESGSATPETGWQAAHLIAEDETGVMCGAMPLYVKYHSQGEYVFDHAWADAYERVGGRYYPKFLAAVPFTPATGPRLLVDSAHPAYESIRSALMAGMVTLAGENNLSSAHINFCPADDAAHLEAAGLMIRHHQQFHWFNAGYADFEAFLAATTSRKRKQIRKERRAAVESGIGIEALTGDAITSAHWDDFWCFYQDTGARKWGSPYLTRAFFDYLHETMRDDILLIMCSREGRNIAAALNFIGRDTLYGRYWGCIEDVPYLHFEACYYRAIDYAIAERLLRIEAGAQGSHKLARGYVPVTTCSAHWIRHPEFRAAVAEFLAQEREALRQDAGALMKMTPFKQSLML